MLGLVAVSTVALLLIKMWANDTTMSLQEVDEEIEKHFNQR